MGKHRGTLDVEGGVICHHPTEECDVCGIKAVHFFDSLLRLLTGSDDCGDLLDFTRRQIDGSGYLVGLLLIRCAEGFANEICLLCGIACIESGGDQGIGEWFQQEAAADALKSGRFTAGEKADGSFERLAGDAGPGDATEDGGFWGANVIAVEAGDRKGLEDVEFDKFHRNVFASVLGSEWREAEHAEAKGLGGADTGSEGLMEEFGIGDGEEAGEFGGGVQPSFSCFNEGLPGSGDRADFLYGYGESVLSGLATQPVEEVLAGGNGDAFRTAALACHVTWSREFAGGIGEQ